MKIENFIDQLFCESRRDMNVTINIKEDKSKADWLMIMAP